MSLRPGERELLALVDGRSVHLPNVTESQNKTGLTQRAIEAYNKSQEALEGSVVDDGVPPADPVGGAVVAGVRSLIVSWAPPAVTDHVQYTVVTVEAPPGTVVQTKNVVGTSLTVTGLTAATEYTVKLKHVDVWGLESGVVTAGTGTAVHTVADEIDLDAAIIAGSLGWDTIDTITDPDVMGDDVIVARAMAVQDAAALNLWVGDAAIQSAKIAALSADKITAGDIDVALNVTAGGAISGGGTVLDANGITLKDTALVEGSFPAETGDWITPPARGGSPNPWAGLGFFYDDAAVSRGVVIRASGAGGFAREGRVILSADEGFQGSNDLSTAKIRLESSASGLARVKLQGQVQLSGTVSPNAPITGAGLDSGVISIANTTRFGNSTGIRVYRIDRMCIMRGRFDVLTGGGGADSSHNIINLPAGFQPSTFHYVIAAAQVESGSVWDGQRRIVIESGGAVHMAAGESMVGGRTMSLDGLVYYMD